MEKGKAMRKHLTIFSILILIILITSCSPENISTTSDEITEDLEDGYSTNNVASNYLLKNRINPDDISAIHFRSEFPGEDFFGLKVITDRDEITKIVYALNHATIGAQHEPYDGGGSSLLLLENDIAIYEFNFGASGYNSVYLGETRRWMYYIQFSGPTLLELREGSTAEWEYVYR